MRKIALVALFCCVAAPAFAQDVGAPAQPTVLQQLAKDAGPYLVDLAGVVVVALLGLLGRLAHTMNQSNLLARGMAIAADYLNGAVKHLIEGLAPDIKADLADGVIDADERQHLLDKAWLLVKAELPSPVQAILASGFGAGLETMLRGKIASALDSHLTAVASAPSAAQAAPTTPAPEPKPTVP